MIFIRTISGMPPCPHCGQEAESITRSGRLGCPGCYTHFETLLTPTLRRICGNAVHTGDIPASAGAGLRLARRKRVLSETLREAIAVQDFERCAALRDEIKELDATAEDQSARGGDQR